VIGCGQRQAQANALAQSGGGRDRMNFAAARRVRKQ
jgi:hypothetical protein